MSFASVARAASAATDERLLLAVLGSLAIVVGIAVVRMWRG
jgi:hypothetical protein